MPRSLQFRKVRYPAVNSARSPHDRMAHGFSAVVLIHSATREKDGPGLVCVAVSQHAQRNVIGIPTGLRQRFDFLVEVIQVVWKHLG